MKIKNSIWKNWIPSYYSKEKKYSIFRSLKDIIYMNQNFTDYFYFCSQKYGIYMIQNL